MARLTQVQLSLAVQKDQMNFLMGERVEHHPLLEKALLNLYKQAPAQFAQNVCRYICDMTHQSVSSDARETIESALKTQRLDSILQGQIIHTPSVDTTEKTRSKMQDFKRDQESLEDKESHTSKNRGAS